MPTSHTLITIYNMALDMIVEFPVTTTQDPGPYCRWLNRNFTPVVEATLRQQPWNFACELHVLSADPDRPAYRWGRRFALPPGWLRVLPPTHNMQRGGEPIPHEVKGNYLLTNSYEHLPVECVMNKQDPGEWDPLFATVIAARLANGMAHRFTAKNSFAELTKQAAQDALETAAEINAFEGSMEPIEQFDILRARGETRW